MRRKRLAILLPREGDQKGESPGLSAEGGGDPSPHLPCSPGKAYESEELASRIEKLSLIHDRLAFVVGGPLGLSKGVLDRSHEIFSLSRLTLTHEMSRLILLEQLYRAFTILRGEKYHK